MGSGPSVPVSSPSTTRVNCVPAGSFCAGLSSYFTRRSWDLRSGPLPTCTSFSSANGVAFTSVSGTGAPVAGSRRACCARSFTAWLNTRVKPCSGCSQRNSASGCADWSEGRGVSNWKVYGCASAVPSMALRPAGTVTVYRVPSFRGEPGTNSTLAEPSQRHSPSSAGSSFAGAASPRSAATEPRAIMGLVKVMVGRALP